MTEQPTTIATLPRRPMRYQEAGELRINLHLGDRTFIELGVWEKFGGQWKPCSARTRLSPTEIDQVVAALERARDMVRETAQ